MKKNLLLSFALIALMAVGAKAQTASVKMVVDMSYQLVAQVSTTVVNQVSATTGKFDPATDFIDVAGTFNNWPGDPADDYHLTMVEGSDSTLWEITIPDLTVGDVLEFKFRINGSWADATSEFPAGGPNRKYTVREGGSEIKMIYNNYYYGWVPVTINVNMNKKIADAAFDPATELVDVAGDFNNWGNGGYDQLWDANSDGIYTKQIIAPIGTQGWKARINSEWSKEHSEFWDGSNRELVVADTVGGVVNEVTVWFNDEELSVNSNAFANVEVYPIPAIDQVTVDNTANATVVELVNVVGKTVKAENVNNQNRVVISTSDLASGIYFVVVKDAANNSRTIKVVKQ